MSGSAPTQPTTAELLGQLPPLPDVKRPMLTPDNVALNAAKGDVDDLAEMISGQYFNFMLDELLKHLPDVAERLNALGPAGLVMQSRPSNTINALTIPTRDGVIIVYNIGYHGMLYSFANAVAKTIEQRNAGEAVRWLAGLVDWATSHAKEPRFDGQLKVGEEKAGLAAKLVSCAGRFVLCHELGHAVTLDRDNAPLRKVKVAGVAIQAELESWAREFDADRDGLTMYLRVLAARGQSASDALIGAEVFLNAAAMLHACSAGEEDTHPPPDQRLDRVRSQFREACGDRAEELAGPAMAVRYILKALRGSVPDEVQRRRAETTRRLEAAFQSYVTQEPGLDKEGRRAVARTISRYLLDSPGATLDYLHRQIFAPKGADELDGASPARILAVNAALHFEKPLQEAIEIPRLRLG